MSSYKVGDTTYKFPDSMSDDEAQRTLVNQGVITPGPKYRGGNAGEGNEPSNSSQAEYLPPGLRPDNPGKFIDAATYPVEGAKQVLRGVPALSNGRYARGASDVIEGTGKTLSPIAIPALAANPLAVGAGMAASAVGGYGGRKAGEAAGLSPDQIDLAGDAGSLIGGAAGSSPKVPAFIRGAAREIPSALSDNLTIPRNIHDLMTKNVPIPTAVGAGIGALVGHPYEGGAIGAGLGMVPPIVRGGMSEAGKAPWLPNLSGPVNPFQGSDTPLLNRGGIVSPPPASTDASYVRVTPAMAYPPNPSRALSGPQPVMPMPGNVAPDISFVRGVPAMAYPPNPARALPSGSNVIQMPSPADTSYVHSIDADYPEVLKGPLTPPEVAARPLSPTPISSNSGVTQQYQPSRTKARFDASGKRIGG